MIRAVTFPFRANVSKKRARRTTPMADASPSPAALQEASDGFFLAAEYGRADVIKALADHGRGQLELRDIVDPKTGRSPLHVAVANGKKDALRVLLAAGFPPDHQSFESSDPTQSKQPKSVGNHSAYALAQQLQAQDLLFVFHQFLIQQVAGNDVQAVEQLLAAGVAVDVTDAATKNTLLHWAVSCQAMDVLEYLLKRVEVQQQRLFNHRNAEGATPLHIACHGNQLECTQLLLRHHADVSIKGGNGFSHEKTALELATSPEVQALFTKDSDGKDEDGDATTTQTTSPNEAEGGEEVAAFCGAMTIASGERRGSLLCPHEAQNSKLLLQLEEKDLLVNQLKKTIEVLVEESQEIQKLGEERVMLEYVRKLREEKAVVQQQLEDANDYIKDQQQQLDSLKAQIRLMCAPKQVRSELGQRETDHDALSHTSDDTGSTAPGGGPPASSNGDFSGLEQTLEEPSETPEPAAQPLKLDAWTSKAQREQDAIDQHMERHGSDIWSTVWSGLWPGNEENESREEDGEVIMTV
ncbi:hypothetical protein BBJ28_00007610 [Nothophytophthora sp. Chile5]|nr:hypothetical protein BBJ28_00007610 [Nothophytophthora sp. Chile5]